MAYRSATIGGVGHLGRTTYDGETNLKPGKTLCGIKWVEWTVSEPRLEGWVRRRAASVCPTCDRIALWHFARKSEFK
jgi:hypothetical protein